MYESFKASVLGKIIGDGQCVSLIVNNPAAYVEHLFPGVAWEDVMAPVQSAYQLAGKSNSYITWVANDHSDPNQLPSQGDIMVFGPTPQAGYSNTFNNPDGHTGVCDSASMSGYSLLQQNAPEFGEGANVTEYGWKFRPCLGWYTVNSGSPAPAPTPPPASGAKIFLPSTTGPWHLYKVGGPYNPAVPADVKGILVPSDYPPGLTYDIDANRGNGVYTVTTQDFGQGDLWTKGSDVVIS